MNASRIEYRNGNRGWAAVTVKDSKGGTLEVFMVRNNADSLAGVSARMKAQGAQGVSWGACGDRFWVGMVK